MNLAEYIRMSTDKQEDSPETQQKIIREYCAREGHGIIKTYQDLGKSGGSMEGRAALRELLRDAEKRLFDGVIIYKLDRAFRNLGEQVVTLKKLKQIGIRLLAAADPMSEGAAGDLIANVLGAVNQFERELTGERIYHHNRELAKKGKWTGGSRPPLGYGYDKENKEIYIIPEEAETVKMVYDIFRRTQGTSITSQELNSLGLRTKDGLTWAADLVHNVLNNPFYTGKVRYGYRKAFQSEDGKKYCKVKRGESYDIFDGQHEAIISEEVFNEVQDVFRQKNTYKKKSDRVYYYTGILKCKMCGGPVTGAYHPHIDKKGCRCLWHVNRKHSCKGFYRNEEYIDSAFASATMDNFDNVIKNYDLSQNLSSVPPKKDYALQLRKVDQKINRQKEMYENGIIDEDEFYTKIKESMKEKKELEKKQTQDNKSIQVEDINTLFVEFKGIWTMRDRIPLEYRKMVRTLVKEMYTDGNELDIYYKPMPIPGWQEHVRVQVKT